MGYRIKWRFLVKLAIVLLLAGGTIFFVHRWQVKSQVGAFLYQADRAHEAAEQAAKDGNAKAAGEERDREQNFLQRYILARPDDIDVRERLARLMCENAKTGRQKLNAFFVLEDVLRLDESREELRRFTIDYAMNRLGMIKEAKFHLSFLFTLEKDLLKREKNAKDGELRGLYARCFAAERDFKTAESEYITATDARVIRPGTIKLESYFGLAFVQRQLNRENADSQIQRMLREHETDVQSYLFALMYLREFGLQELSATKDPLPRSARSHASLVSDALRIAPKNLDVLIAAADLAQAQSRRWGRTRDYLMKAVAKQKSLEARDLLQTAIKEHPVAENAYIAMAAFEAEERQLADAIQVVRKGLEKDELRDSPRLLHGLMEYQFRAGDSAVANETLKKLQERGLQPGVEEFELARVMILEDKWKEAAASLEKAMMHLQDRPATVRQAHLLLGRCYAELGAHERRLHAYSLALPNEVATPQWGAAMIGIAESEVALGRVDDALKTYRKAAEFFPALWVPVARLELVRVLQSSDAKPDWAQVDEAVKQAEHVAGLEGGRYIPDPTEQRILKASVHHYKGDPVKARYELNSLLEVKPKNAAIRVELAMQSLREGKEKYPEALAELEKAVKEIGDSPDVRLAKVRVWAAMNVKDLSAILTDLAFKTDSLFPPGTTEAAARAQKRRLVRGLAEIANASGAEEAANRLWNELAVAKPFDISVHLIRFERANRAGNGEEMKSILAQIAQIDGDQGRTTRLARVAVLIRESERSNNRELRNQALHILDALEREQQGASSGRVILLQGFIHDLNGNRDLAKVKYRQAIDRGELKPEVIRRQIELLSIGGDEEAEEARALIDKLKNATELGPDFQRLAASVSLRADDVKAALEFARAVKEDSKNYQDQLFLGHIYWRSKDPTKLPEPRFRQATELAPDVMETWLTRMQYLLAVGKQDDAAKVFEQAREKVKTDDRALFTALSFVQRGETKKATEAFEQARNARPDDIRVLTAEAEYLLRIGRLVEARAGYDRVLDSSKATAEEKTVARQRKAIATAADPDYQTSRQAPMLNPLTGNETPAQRRAHAVVLGMQRNTALKREAIKLLEDNKKGSAPSERFILAQLYQAVGNRTGVPLVMEELLLHEKDRQPLYLRYYARWLLRDGDPSNLSKAARWIEELGKKDPDSLGTAELRARLAAARKDIRGAWEALRAKAEAPNAPVAVIAGICEDIGLYDKAEELSKSFVDRNKQSQPRVVLGLAEFYGRRGRTAEGIQICDEMRSKLPLTMVGAAAINVLYNAQSPNPADAEKVAGWLDSSAQTAAGQERAALLQLLAGIRNLQGQYAEAAKLYRQVLTENQRDALALNNLAYLLSAAENNHTEALAIIAQAKQILGDHTVLLDTEALILLKSGRPKDALPLMDEVVKRAPSGSAYFHLAQIELALKRDNDFDAKAAWGVAQERGLKEGDLHPLEREAYKEFKARWN